MRSIVSQDSISVPIGGDPAGVTSTEPAVAVSRDEPVDAIPQPGRYDPEDSSQPPGIPERLVDADDRITVLAYPIALHHQQAYRIFGIHAVPAIEGLADRALHGGEAESRRAIARQDELGVGRAQHAFGVEQDDGTSGIRCRAGSRRHADSLTDGVAGGEACSPPHAFVACRQRSRAHASEPHPITPPAATAAAGPGPGAPAAPPAGTAPAAPASRRRRW